MAPPRVLVIDDEPSVLDVLARQLDGEFEVRTALGGAAGLDALRGDEQFAVVVCDMRMPGVSGVHVLEASRRLAPDTARILLTGYADLPSAVSAVNRGGVSCYLVKPCPRQVLTHAVHEAAEQHRRAVAEKELLEQTLTGSIEALLDTLALANPVAFDRAVRIKRSAMELADLLDAPKRWEIEGAAMLSQLGAVTLPPATAEKLHRGRALDEAEQALVDQLPEIAERLLGRIPRLDPVREIVRWQGRRFDGRERRPGPGGQQIPLGSRILRVTIDDDAFRAAGLSPVDAAVALRTHAGRYDPAILNALVEHRRAQAEAEAAIRKPTTIRGDELCVGMVLAADVRTVDGVLLVAAGNEVRPGLLERIRNFRTNIGLEEPLAVFDVDAEAATAGAF
jgi:response regulator RpfG family c-di-GMP phosphodiesterase